MDIFFDMMPGKRNYDGTLPDRPYGLRLEGLWMRRGVRPPD